MGVTGLFKFLKDKYGDNIYEHVHMSHLSYKIIYFDISSYIFSYIKIYGNQTNKWLNGFVKMFMLFKQYRIHLIPVFDGKSPPEKKEEREDRKLQVEKSDEKCMNISMDLESYKNTGTVSDLLLDTMKRLSKNSQNSGARLLGPDPKKEYIDVELLQDYIYKKEVALTDISKNDIQQLQDLLKAFGIPFIQAPDEAETLCCDLVKRGLGYAAFSLDSDCVAYDTSFIINDIDMTSHTFRIIDMKKLYTIIELSPEQLRDLCILCGVDYNRHSKPKTGLGPVSSYKLLKEYGSFDEVIKVKNIQNADGYRHKRCNELFSLTYPYISDDYVWESIQSETLIKYLKENKLLCDVNKISSYWQPIKLVFEDA